MPKNKKVDYWDSYYSSLPLTELHVPSQFAAFVASECRGAKMIVDVGCGNGRDSVFFSNHFDRVVGVDSSAGGINFCTRFAAENKYDNVSFRVSSVASSEFLGLVEELIAGCKAGDVVFYSRFFLHALTTKEETTFFGALSKAARKGDRLALEYRTVRDASGEKQTPHHYRRFVSPPQVFSELEQHGFALDYAAEGFGMAKYKVDDAYVARSLHTKL
jgi:SAM-dependent methyltransferase